MLLIALATLDTSSGPSQRWSERSESEISGSDELLYLFKRLRIEHISRTANCSYHCSVPETVFVLGMWLLPTASCMIMWASILSAFTGSRAAGHTWADLAGLEGCPSHQCQQGS